MHGSIYASSLARRCSFSSGRRRPSRSPGDQPGPVTVWVDAFDEGLLNLHAKGFIRADQRFARNGDAIGEENRPLRGSEVGVAGNRVPPFNGAILSP